MSFSDLKWEGMTVPAEYFSIQAKTFYFQFRVWIVTLGEHKGLYCGSIWLIVQYDGKLQNADKVRDIDYYPTVDLAKEKVLEEGLKIVRDIIREAKILSTFSWKKSKRAYEKVYTHEKEMTYLTLRVRKIEKGEHRGEYLGGVFYTGVDGSLEQHLYPTFHSAKHHSKAIVLGIVEKIAQEAGLNY